MSENISMNHNRHQPPLMAEPPCASDGNDIYIRKLLAPVSGGEAPEGDSFFSHREKTGGEGEEGHHGNALNTVIKFSGVVLATVLGIKGIRYFTQKG